MGHAGNNMTGPTDDTTSPATAEQLLPGGYGRSALYVGGRTPPLVVRGEGYKLEDEAGRSIIDLNNNFTALVHGHAHPRVIAAAQDALATGTAFGLPNRFELTHARTLMDRFRGDLRVRYVNSGTEAVMTAVRLARAYTRRDVIVVVKGAYHGTADAVVPNDTGTAQYSPGVPQGVRKATVTVPLNDVTALEQAGERLHGKLAAILLDLLPNRAGMVAASPEFVASAERVARDQNGLLMVDEVISARLAYGGLQQVYGVRPDLTILGKLIGGGFPVGAIVGSAGIMDLLNPARSDSLDHGGTFSANPVTMAAGVATLELLNLPAIEHLNQLGQLLRSLLTPVAAQQGWEVRGWGSLGRLIPASGDAKGRVHALWWAAYERGVLLMPTGAFCVSTPMSPETVESAAESLAAALADPLV